MATVGSACVLEILRQADYQGYHTKLDSPLATFLAEYATVHRDGDDLAQQLLGDAVALQGPPQKLRER